MRFPWVISGLMVILFLASCEQQKPEMKKEHNRSGKPITITVYEYNSYKEVSDALAKFQKDLNQPVTKETSLGWSGWDREEPFECVIHIKPPKRIDDEDTLTLGHEMSHCLYGSYHD